MFIQCILRFSSWFKNSNKSWWTSYSNISLLYFSVWNNEQMELIFVLLTNRLVVAKQIPSLWKHKQLHLCCTYNLCKYTIPFFFTLLIGLFIFFQLACFCNKSHFRARSLSLCSTSKQIAQFIMCTKLLNN